ncbi:MAG: MCE family protein [Acidimicrobiales bacterium]
MKSFTERNPYIIGAIAIGIILAFTAGALFLTSGIFKSTYPVSAVFADAAGLRSGDQVLVAGVVSGSVGSIEQYQGHVKVGLKINQGIKLPTDSAATIQVETLLGTKDVRIDAGADWSHLLGSGAVITKTSTPVELLQLQDEAVPVLNGVDSKSLNQLFSELSAVTHGQAGNVAQIISGLNKLTSTVDQRTAEVKALIDAGNTLSTTLAAKDTQLLNIVDNLNVVLGGLNQRKVQLARFIQQADQAAAQTSSLVGANKDKLNSVLAELHTDLDIVNQHQVDLAQGIAYLTSAIEGFASIGYSGPSNTPTPWANIFTSLAGPLGYDAIFGSCGELDNILNTVLGPDPLPCSQRTGPVGGQPASGAPAPATPSAAMSSPTTATAGSTTAPPPGFSSVGSLLSRMSGGA